MIFTDDLKQLCRRLVAAVLLFVIVTHAAAPFVQSVERQSGSAFSADTSDVSLACGHTVGVAKRIVTATPAVPPPILLPIVVEIAPLTVCRPEAGGAGQTGPPASRTIFSPLTPRAPPAA